MIVRRIISLLMIVALVVSTAAPLAAHERHCAGEEGVRRAIMHNAMHEEHCEACEHHCGAEAADTECDGACGTSGSQTAEHRGDRVPTTVSPATYHTEWTFCCCDHAAVGLLDRVAAAGVPTSHITFLAKAPIQIPSEHAGHLISFVPRGAHKIGASPPFLASSSPPLHLRLGIFLI
ncbi:MAG TPA: hypothetical protein VHI13_15895 [Candidatus Kapabacteria bacterium]|nr:hypothetical protein [Candidatus Kapabacteria bacterium]